MVFNVKNKKITVMGLGLLGRGINDVKFLAKQGADLIVTDLKTKEQLKDALKEIKGLKVKLVLGKHRKEDFKNRDYILKAAGVPLDSPYIKYAQKNGIPIKMDESWFAQYCPCPIVGVTGTRGKTTTTYIIDKILNKTSKKVFKSGNIKGKATLPLVNKVKSQDLIVLELSSWQLQGWHDEKISPHIAVITNIYKDHLDYYKNNMKKYVKDKTAIFKYQTKDDYLILNKNNPYSKQFAKEAKSRIIWFSDKDIPKSWDLKVLGQHNQENAAAAVKVGQVLGIKSKDIKSAVEAFCPVEDRLEFVAEKQGIKFYNDTSATTAEATLAALNSFDQQVVLLAGGTDKNAEYASLAKPLKNQTKAIILFEGTAAPKIRKQLNKVKYDKTLVYVESMKEAFKQAKYILQPGDVFLMSPAAASFGIFINAYDRGEQFRKQVKQFKLSK